MLNKMRTKRTGGNMVVSALLTVIIGWILVAFYFWYFGQSLDKNDVTKVWTELRQNMADVAAQVQNGADITLNNTSVVNKLKNQYTNDVIVLRKGMTVMQAFLPNTDLSGTTLSGVVAGINDGNRYLVLESNDALMTNTGYIVDGKTVNPDFTAVNHNADEAGLTYRGVYFLVPATEKATWDKIASANIGRISVSPITTIKDGSTSIDVILIHLLNVGEKTF